ncbi:MAG TPA: P-loop NTPase [Acidimicrobiales bacterium]|nr:P-loop NTPase [Acidimicrobiales bacterium]
MARRSSGESAGQVATSAVAAAAAAAAEVAGTAPSGSTETPTRPTLVTSPASRQTTRPVAGVSAPTPEPALREEAEDAGPVFVAVVEEDAVFLTRIIGELAAFSAAPFSSLDELAMEAGLDRHPVIVIVLGPSQAEEDVLERLRGLIRSRAGLGAVLVVAENSAGILRMALRAGIDDAIGIDSITEDLVAAVRELGYRLSSEVADAAEAAPPVVEMGPAQHGRVTAVYSPKGGVGKSVVAVNLATALARRSRQPVVIVDLDLQFGDVAVMLRMQPIHNVAEASLARERLDAELARNLLARHEGSGVLVMAAPTEPSMEEHVTPAMVSRLLRVLREIGVHVVVDTPPHLSDVLLQLLDDSDDIVLVVGMDVPSVKNARLGLQTLELVSVPLDRVIVVLNRADSKVHLSVRDVERTLRMKIDVTLPSDALVTQSVNKGIPAVMEYERSRFTASVMQLAEMVRARTAAASG